MRKPSASTVISLVALFFAMGGSAIAARHYLVTSTSQIKPNVLRALHGKRGEPGFAGPQGPTGPAGPSNLGALTIVNGPSENVPPGEVQGSIATCPAGSHAVSGGGYGSISGIDASRMSTDHQSWFVIITNDRSITETVEAVAYCAAAGQAVAATAPHTAHLRAVRESDVIVSRLARELSGR